MGLGQSIEIENGRWVVKKRSTIAFQENEDGSLTVLFVRKPEFKIEKIGDLFRLPGSEELLTRDKAEHAAKIKIIGDVFAKMKFYKEK